MTVVSDTLRAATLAVDTMRATLFRGARDSRGGSSPAPCGRRRSRDPGHHDDLRTDPHIVKGEYPVRPGLVIGHEPVGVIEELGPGATGYEIGQRVLVGAITPCGQCRARLSGHLSPCGHGGAYEALGGWRFGNDLFSNRRGGVPKVVLRP